MFPETLLAPSLDLSRFARILDELGHTGRLDTIRHLTAADMARLFEAAKGHRALSLEDFGPAAVAAATPVIHEGKNSLPLFHDFQKHMVRPEPDADHLWGRNLSSTTRFIGPGCFVARLAPEEPGALRIDYGELPKGKPPTWPEVVPPRLIGWFVFGGLVDIVRGVSSHVAIGRGHRRGKALDAYFALCRVDAEP